MNLPNKLTLMRVLMVPPFVEDCMMSIRFRSGTRRV